MSNGMSWRQIETAWENLTKREKVLIFATISALPLALIFVLVLEPALDRLQGIDDQISTLEQSVQTQENVLSMLQNAPRPDPNLKAQAQLTSLVNQLDQINNDVELFAQRLVGPEQMLGLLHSVLEGEKQLELVEALSLPVQPLTLKKPEEENATPELSLPKALTAEAEARAREKAMQEAVIYVHPFQLQLKGSYQALYNYLQRIEQLHQGFFWDQLELNAEKYPEATIRVRVHTLSTEESWLGA